MKKNRTKRSSHAKKRSILLVFVGILGLAMILLGGAIGYKIFQKYTFDETIQTIKNEKDQLFNEGSQKESFKKGQAEIIEVVATPGMKMVGDTLQNLNLPKGVLIASIYRQGVVIIPDGNARIKDGDRVIMFSLLSDIADLEKLMKGAGADAFG